MMASSEEEMFFDNCAADETNSSESSKEELAAPMKKCYQDDSTVPPEKPALCLDELKIEALRSKIDANRAIVRTCQFIDLTLFQLQAFLGARE